MKKKLTVLLASMALFSTTALAATETEVSVPSSSGEYNIPAVLTLPDGEGPFPLVVMNHGFGGTKEEGHGFTYIARELADSDIASIRMDFIGTGDSEVDFVNFSLTSSVRDSNDCLQYALENADIDPEKLGIFGYSNGGKITALISNAEDNPYSVRVYLAPAIYEENPERNQENLEICQKDGYVEKEHYGTTLKIGEQFYQDKIEFLNQISEFEQPGLDTLLIYGTEDTVIPTQFSVEFAGKLEADVLQVFGANHGYGFYDDSDEGYKILDTVSGSAVSYFRHHLTDANAKNEFGSETGK